LPSRLGLPDDGHSLLDELRFRERYLGIAEAGRLPSRKPPLKVSDRMRW
jgi:hypothetical protein